MLSTTNTYNNPPVFLLFETIKESPKEDSQMAVVEKLNQIIDLIQFRVGKQLFAEIAESLKSNVFELRGELINFKFHHTTIGLKEIPHFTVEEISQKLQGFTFPLLRETIANILEAHLKITSPSIISIEKEEKRIGVKNLVKNQITYKELERFKSAIASDIPKIKYWFDWVDESLKLDVGLIAADLILKEKIGVNQTLVSELNQFLKRTVSQFGAYAIANGIWQPDDEDRSQLVTNMRILSGALEVELGLTQPISAKGLKNMILS